LYYISPIGTLRIEASDRGLCALRYLSPEEASAANTEQEVSQSENAMNCTALCISALNCYFVQYFFTIFKLTNKKEGNHVKKDSK
jgi:methylated-DNA-[protein]-cysteine S-methyltransferase